jgi:predicted RNA binding protein YcfA (HicA-like mRNA interferase family)
LPKLPVVSGREAVAALQRAGFAVDHRRSSHVYLYHAKHRRTVTVPVHANRDLPPGTLRAILRQAGLTVEEFLALLD